jgi:structure-specific endonuclease subunit SLX1
MTTPARRWVVYVLVGSAGKTYVGITTDQARRLAQHNGQARGGARATRAGRPWRVGAIYGPFRDRRSALRAELAVKRLRGPHRLAWRV